MLKQTDKEIKVNLSPIKGDGYLKTTSQKHTLLKNLNLKLLNNNFLNKESNRNFKLKSERGLRKERSFNDKNSISILSRAKSKANFTNRKRGKSFIGSSSSKSSQENNNIMKKTSSSLVKSSEIESSKNSVSSNSNSNSNEEDESKSNSNKSEKESEEKLSYSNENNKENNDNNENNDFSRIEEEESSDNSQNQESNEIKDNNLNWSKKFRNKIFERFKRMVRIINQKKKIDYNSIILAIQEDEDDKVYEVLIDEDFKNFYRNKDNLFEKDVFMDEMIKYKKFELLKKVSEDPSYEFDKDYIFNCLFFCINPKIYDENNKNKNSNKNQRNIICCSFNYDFFNNVNLGIDNSVDKYIRMKAKKSFKNINDITMLEIIEGLIENHLYDNSSYKKMRIILWFMTLLGLNDSFITILKQNEKLFYNSLKKEEKEDHDLISLSKILDEIINNKEIDIKDFDSYTIKYYLKTIEDCLSCDLEDLAILLANLRKPYPELIASYKIAVKFENMMYLKFIWEKSISYNKKILKESEAKIGLINRSKFRNSRNSIRNIMFNIDISEIINILIKNHKEDKYSDELNYKIRKIFEWNNIEQEVSLLKSLFD